MARIKKFLGIILLVAYLSSAFASTCDTKNYSMADISKHNNKDSCWIILNKKVYDVTKYMGAHPAPARVLERCCGKDCTKGFDTKFIGEPHTKKAQEQKDKLCIGSVK